MGFLKKITRPISKVLDKVIPNEIKPALPFLSAAAPFLLPAGIAGGSGISALLRRGALTGGINIASQLAQEGSEGDFSGLSALLAAGTGALTAPGASSTLEQFRSPVGEFDPARTFLQKGKDMGITGLQKASEFLTTSGETLRSPGFNKATAEAALLPVTQGTMDLGIAEARRTAKDLANDALASLPEGASDADRALAIRQFMEAAGYFSEDEIVDTITAAGYADGGRVGLEFGGTDSGNFDDSSDNNLSIGCIIIGEYYDMPVSPDLSVKRSIKFDKQNVQESLGGQRFSTMPSYGKGYLSASNKSPFHTYTGNGERGVYGGRISYDIKFSYLNSSDVMPTTYDIQNQADDTVVSDIWNYTHGGHIPFIFTQDGSSHDETDYLFARFAQDSLSMTQVAPDVFSIAMKIEEEF